MQSRYHEGEVRAQQLAGERDMAAQREGMVEPRIIPQAVRWLGAQTLAVISTVDADADVWATVLTGEAGFLRADADGAALFVGAGVTDAIRDAVRAHRQVGVLAIDLSTRQRMRVNGSAVVEGDGLRVQVAEAFFNCPKYITRRFVQPQSGPLVQSSGMELCAEHLRLLHETDVLFLATTHPDRGPDASHRGGDPGFVQVLPDGRIRFADYPGNSLFNSLGNLLVDPRVGIAVPNLRSGAVLQVTGTAAVVWNEADDEGLSGGTHRFVDVAPTAWRVVDGGPVAGVNAELSPFNPR
jgi:uncharacterized protein